MLFVILYLNRAELKMIDKFRGKYGFLSNMYACNIEGYPSSEHAFVAAKTLDPEIKEYIKTITTPVEAKKFGRTLSLRPDWSEKRIELMYEILKVKFNQEPFRTKLIETGDEELIEGNWWNDTYWGVCNGVGENNLGKLLMKIRDELNE